MAEIEAAADEVPFDQRSIDDFLGLNADPNAGGAVFGLSALAEAQTVPHERIPMLEAVFDRLLKLQRISARKLTSDLVEVRLDGIHSLRFNQYMSSVLLPSVFGVIKTQSRNSFGLVTIDSSLVYALTDVVFGGTASLVPPTVEGRNFSSIEMSILRRFLGALISDINEAFNPIGEIDFALDHFETNPRFAGITQAQNVVAVANYKIELGSLQGFFEIILPFTTLEPLREALNTSYIGDRLGQDEIWNQHLASEVARANLDLRAMLFEQEMPIGRVLNLAIGETLMLETRPDNLVKLRYGDLLMAEGKMGRVENKIVVQVVNTYHHPSRA